MPDYTTKELVRCSDCNATPFGDGLCKDLYCSGGFVESKYGTTVKCKWCTRTSCASETTVVPVKTVPTDVQTVVVSTSATKNDSTEYTCQWCKDSGVYTYGTETRTCEACSSYVAYVIDLDDASSSSLSSSSSEVMDD